jgi:hypothetical protein
VKKLAGTLLVAMLVIAGCSSSDDDSTEDADTSTTQAADQTTETAATETPDTDAPTTDSVDGEGEGETAGVVAPDGMLEACNGANTYTDPGYVPEEEISSEEERVAIEQVAALSKPITEFKVVEGSPDGTGYVGLGETDGWAWFCVYGPETDQFVFLSFQGATTVGEYVAPEDGRWESFELS